VSRVSHRWTQMNTDEEKGKEKMEKEKDKKE
jgi:hypothetical protein